MASITVFNQRPQPKLPVICLSVAHLCDVIESSAWVLVLLLPLIMMLPPWELGLGVSAWVFVFSSAILRTFSPDTTSHSVPLLIQYQLSPHCLFQHCFTCDRLHLLSIHCLLSASGSYRDTRPIKAILVFTSELEPSLLTAPKT